MIGSVIRSVLFWVCVVAWSVPVGLAVVLVLVLTLGRLRRRLIAVAGPIWGRPILAAAGVRLRVQGREHLEGRTPRVVLLNHSSSLDLWIGSSLVPPGSTVLAKRELRRVPLLGQAFRLLGVVFVDRGDPAQARAAVEALGEDVRRERLTVWVAPEGTRSRTGALGSFKLGGFRLARACEVPLVPVVLHGAFARMPAGGWSVSPGEVVVDVRAPREIPAGADLRAYADAMEADYARWLTDGPPG